MSQRKGIVLAGGSGTRLHPLTIAVSKQLMPVYDKPMIYYPISVLMFADIRDVLLISNPHELPAFKRLLGNGQNLGMRFTYAEQENPTGGLAEAMIIGEEHVAGGPSALVLGDNLFYGHDLAKSFERASARLEGATIFGHHVADPANYGVVEFAPDGRVLSLEEKPSAPKSSYAIPGLYFYDGQAPALARSLKPSPRGQLEITDLNRLYLERGQLHVELIGRGTAWLDTGTHDSLLEAAQFVSIVQRRQGLMIACLDEIAWRKDWISREQLQANVAKLGESTYGVYLRRLLSEEDADPSLR
ncbi:MAG TPA: glucose-1-phosphate thymidylyltransferase RfbA [Chloroflexota bacterium]|nr:glucose-1-phosphate thymidylyltransferase RfbA [Chloroflexota bacterium]